MTALEETWGNSENILFLGEWCKRYERRNIWEQRNHEVIQFHWDDRVKLRRDYDYLVSLHHSFLAILTQALNEYHKVGHNLRYWQILLDPWLMSYLSVMFDRWECLRSAFETSENLSVILSENCDPLPPPYSYSEFVSLAASSDEWNQNIYHKIINSEYLGRFSISSLGLSFRRGTSGSTATTAIRQSILRKIASVSIGYIEKFVKSNDIVFIGSSFNWRALVKINLSLGQFPLLDPLLAFRTANNKSARDISCTGLPRRADLVINYSSESRFERFVINSIIDDIPRCLVEDYPILRDLTSYIPIRPKVIVTGSSHWADTFAKMWFAEQVRRGVKYVVLEHGGSLPPFMELFDFEADISDVRASWFMPYHSKHVRLPPPKIVGRYTNLYSIIRGLLTQKKYCTVIGNECARWVIRAHFYPMAHQWSASFNMILALYDRLGKDIKECFRVKPYPTQGWNTWQRFSDAIGSDKITKEKVLARVYSMSRVIVCSYPETTFSEAMASGVPTILMYPEHLYELNPIALPLLETLKAGKIVFHDPVSAAVHLNAIWMDPNQWWNSPATVFAREEFYRQALDMDPNWLSKWTDFLKDISEKSTTNPIVVTNVHDN